MGYISAMGKQLYFKYMTKVRLKSSMDDENGLFSCVAVLILFTLTSSI